MIFSLENHVIPPAPEVPETPHLPGPDQKVYAITMNPTIIKAWVVRTFRGTDVRKYEDAIGKLINVYCGAWNDVMKRSFLSDKDIPDEDMEALYLLLHNLIAAFLISQKLISPAISEGKGGEKDTLNLEESVERAGIRDAVSSLVDDIATDILSQHRKIIATLNLEIKE